MQGTAITETKDPFATTSQSAPNRDRPASNLPTIPFEHDDILNTLRRMDEKAKREDAAMAKGMFPRQSSGPSTAGPSIFRKRDISTSSGPSRHSDHNVARTLTTEHSSPTRAPDRLTTASTTALQPIDPNSWLSRSMSASRDRTLKPSGSGSIFGSASNEGKATIMDISDDDGDDVVELLDDRIPPGMRKSNKAPPIMVRDQDVKPAIHSSQRGASQSSASRHIPTAPSRSQSFTSSQPNGSFICCLSSATADQCRRAKGTKEGLFPPQTRGSRSISTRNRPPQSCSQGIWARVSLAFCIGLIAYVAGLLKTTTIEKPLPIDIARLICS